MNPRTWSQGVPQALVGAAARLSDAYPVTQNFGQTHPGWRGRHALARLLGTLSQEDLLYRLGEALGV